MNENKEKLELGSKTEPHLIENCEVKVDGNGVLAMKPRRVRFMGSDVFCYFISKFLKR